MRCIGLIIFVCCVTCIGVIAQNATIPLLDEPDVTVLFNTEEIDQLQHLVGVYDSMISSRYPGMSIVDAYKAYLDTTHFDTAEYVGDNFDKLYTKACADVDLDSLASIRQWMDEALLSGLFMQLWDCSVYGEVRRVNDRPELMGYWVGLVFDRGEYLLLLERLGKRNEYYFRYHDVINATGDVGIGPIAEMLYAGVSGKIDLNRDVERLLFAIHYVTLSFNVPYGEHEHYFPNGECNEQRERLRKTYNK